MSSLGLGKKEKTYVSVSQAGIMEVFQYDELTNKVSKYANAPLAYDDGAREIVDLEKFRDTYLDLLAELEIKANSDVVLNLPTVLLGSRELPAMLDDSAVGQSVLAEIENSYIFSRYTPVFDWKNFEIGKNVGMRDVFYCALQDSIVSQISDIFKSFGAKVIDIETSYTSILNGLVRTNLIKNQLAPEASWNLMIVNNDGYALFSMLGSNITDYVQENIPLAAERAEDIYITLSQAVELALLGFPAESLVVVSECDIINAEELCSTLTASGSLQYNEVIYVDDNLYRKDEFVSLSSAVDQKYKLKPSLKTLGMLQVPTLPTVIHFDFIKTTVKQNSDNEVVKFVLGDRIFEITPNSAKIYSAILLVIVIAIFGLLLLLFSVLNAPYASKIDKANAELQEIENEISKLNDSSDSKDSFNARKEIRTVLTNNRIKLVAYRTIGEVIPKKVWMTYFKTYDNGKIIIEGVSGSIDDINEFHRNIINVLPDNGLKLKNATMEESGKEDAAVAQARYYDFIITNDDNYPPPPATPDSEKSKKKKD